MDKNLLILHCRLMPKIKKSKINQLNQFVKIYGKQFFKTNGNVLICKVCDKNFCVDRKSQMDQHIRTSNHEERLLTSTLEKEQLFLNETQQSNCTGEFNQDLTEAMISADIPFWKLQNVCFNNFLKKCTGQNIPCESVLCKVHLKRCYNSKMDFIKSKIKGKKIWVSIDETTDSCGRYIGHFIIGILSQVKEECESFLLNTQYFEATNSTTIARFFEDTIVMVAPEVIDRNDILLFITDAASYMVKAVKALNIIYPKMVHLRVLPIFFIVCV